MQRIAGGKHPDALALQQRLHGCQVFRFHIAAQHHRLPAAVGGAGADKAGFFRLPALQLTQELLHRAALFAGIHTAQHRELSPGGKGIAPIELVGQQEGGQQPYHCQHAAQHAADDGALEDVPQQDALGHLPGGGGDQRFLLLPRIHQPVQVRGHIAAGLLLPLLHIGADGEGHLRLGGTEGMGADGLGNALGQAPDIGKDLLQDPGSGLPAAVAHQDRNGAVPVLVEGDQLPQVLGLHIHLLGHRLVEAAAFEPGDILDHNRLGIVRVLEAQLGIHLIIGGDIEIGPGLVDLAVVHSHQHGRFHIGLPLVQGKVQIFDVLLQGGQGVGILEHRVLILLPGCGLDLRVQAPGVPDAHNAAQQQRQDHYGPKDPLPAVKHGKQQILDTNGFIFLFHKSPRRS